MRKPTLSKQANIDWAEILKPALTGGAIGGGVFGLGSYLFGGDEHETKDAQKKRVLNNLLLGTGLGTAAGGAYGAIPQLFNNVTGVDPKAGTPGPDNIFNRNRNDPGSVNFKDYAPEETMKQYASADKAIKDAINPQSFEARHQAYSVPKSLSGADAGTIGGAIGGGAIGIRQNVKFNDAIKDITFEPGEKIVGSEVTNMKPIMGPNSRFEDIVAAYNKHTNKYQATSSKATILGSLMEAGGKDITQAERLALADMVAGDEWLKQKMLRSQATLLPKVGLGNRLGGFLSNFGAKVGLGAGVGFGADFAADKFADSMYNKIPADDRAVFEAYRALGRR